MPARALQEPNQRARGAGEGYPPVWAATSFFRSPTVSSSLTVKVRFWKRERGRRGVRLWGGYFEARALEKMVVRDRQGQTPVVEGHCRGRPTDPARSGEARDILRKFLALEAEVYWSNKAGATGQNVGFSKMSTFGLIFSRLLRAQLNSSVSCGIPT